MSNPFIMRPTLNSGAKTTQTSAESKVSTLRKNIAFLSGVVKLLTPFAQFLLNPKLQCIPNVVEESSISISPI